MNSRRKLIEVALPLEAINQAAAHEKSVPRKGHPATMHLWWARRPLAAARAVLFAQLVDDPDSTPWAEAILDADERAAWVAAERIRLFRLIEELVKWENSTDERVLAAARAEILRSTDGKPPAILDPFAGGGTIPLEAQRLGLESHGSDLNPVAVLINKALTEIPPTFAGRPPVFPGAAELRMGEWPQATGLAEDVRRYGAWMRVEAEKRIGHLYPKTALPDGSAAGVIGWIWARTVICPNPACRISMPLVRSWWLAKKKGKEAYVVPEAVNGVVSFTIGNDPTRAPIKDADGTVGRTGGTCIGCDSPVDLKYLREEGRSGRLRAQLMAVVAEGGNRRAYGPPTEADVRTADVDRPRDLPGGEVATNARWFSTPAFGMNTFADLFTNRQLVALTMFSDLVGEARDRVVVDAKAAGVTEGSRLAQGGTDGAAYADALATYLAFAVDKLADWSSSICGWINTAEKARDTFARQAIPMTWDFLELNPLSDSVGNFGAHVEWVARAVERCAVTTARAIAVQSDALAAVGRVPGGLLATDPPYYDNIGYSDLSDFFYVWLRRSLRSIHPELLTTLLVPKSEELVANPYRHGGKEGAKTFFESGFREVFAHARADAREDFPITVFYAFKQAETDDDGESSTGWETLLDGMVRGGWRITGTWPMRSERGGRMISVGTNALASSIVLALRPRPENAPVVDRRAFTVELRDVLPGKLRELQQGSIAAVDLPQAAIGPGMAVFSHYAKVVEADGSTMTVNSALKVINQVLGEVLWEQEGDFDPGTRWCVKWFENHGFDPGPYGEAETNASAFNTSVAALDRSGALTARGGKVQLLAPDRMPADYDPRADEHVTLWEVVLQLAKALDENGLDTAGILFARAAPRVDVDAAKELAYLLFAVAERNGWSAIAGLFNLLAASWSDVVDAARRTPIDPGEQLALDATY